MIRLGSCPQLAKGRSAATDGGAFSKVVIVSVRVIGSKIERQV